ncbi:MAG: ABC transporter permease [Bosea sp. (in: a-proteobacteria)]
MIDAMASAFKLLLTGDGELLAVIGLSLQVSLSAALIGFVIGTMLGLWLCLWRVLGRQAILVLINALMGLPPVVAGLCVYLLLSRSGPLGELGLLFTPAAMIIAQSLLTTPIVAALVHRLAQGLWSEYGDALQMDGASRPRAALTLLAMGQATLVTTFLAAFGRAIAEVGAILIVGGNIRGSTRTMTTTIALETSRGDLALALALGLVLVALTVLVSALAFAINARSRS